MKKLEYEKPEIEVLLIDPKVDLLTTRGGEGEIGPGGGEDPDPFGIFNE